ncbi:MAG: M56 family metallopeptidase [Pirellulales bacterium]
MSQYIHTFNAWAESWWPYVLHATWQAALVALVILLLVSVGRRWPSPLRHGLLVLALLKFALPPLLALPTGLFSQVGPEVAARQERAVSVLGNVRSTLASGQPVDGRPMMAGPGDPAAYQPPLAEQATASRSFTPADAETALAERTSVGAGSRTAARDITARGTSTPPAIAAAAVNVTTRASSHRAALVRLAPPRLTWQSWLMLVHATGSAALAAWLAWQWLRLRRVLRQAQRPTDGPLYSRFLALCRRLKLARRPRLLIVPGDGTPFSCGLLRPTVALPQALAQRSSPERVEIALVHELAHHARGDLWINAIQAATCLAWWFNPFVWLTNRALRTVREECCDDLILAEKLAADDAYCAALLHVAAGQGRAPRLALQMAAGPQQLARRFCRIMDRSVHRPGRLSVHGWLLVLFIAALLLPGLRASGGAEPNVEKPSSQPVAGQGGTDNATASKTVAKGELAGTILDADGRPASDAGVWLSINRRPGELMAGRERVVASGKTDEQGRFSLKLPSPSPAPERYCVWVHKAGSLLLARQYSRFLPDEEIEAKLERSIDEPFQVLSPEGGPLAGIRLQLDIVKTTSDGRRHSIDIPERLKARFAAISGDDGTCHLDGVPRDSVAQISLESQEFGKQTFGWFGESTPTESIILDAVGRLTGRIVCDDPQAAAGLKFKLTTSPIVDTTGDAPRRYGVLELTSDEGGRFDVPALAQGELRIIPQEPDDLPYRLVAPEGVVVKPGDTTQLALELKPAVKLTGIVRDKTTGQPIAGAIVARSAFPFSETKSDRQGRFRLYLLPGELWLRITAPPSYLPLVLDTGSLGIQVPAVDEHELPPIELEKGLKFTGRLTSQDDRSFRDVRLTATWQNPGSNGTQVATYSDSQGRFVFPAIHPGREIVLRAYMNGAPICDPVRLAADVKQPYSLRVHLPELAPLAGRVIDRQGQPVPGVVVRITAFNSDTPGIISYSVMDQPVTDHDGRFMTVPMVKQGDYKAAAMDGDLKLAESESLTPSEDGTTEFADLEVARRPEPPALKSTLRNPDFKSLRVKVVDAAGRAIGEAGIIAWFDGNRVRTTADANGRLRLSDVPDHGGFIFVSAPGCRFHGEYVHPASGEVKMVVSRVTDPPLPALATLPSLPAADDIAELGRPWFDAMERRELRVGETKVDRDDLRAAELMAQLDPLRSLEFFAEHHAPSHRWNARQKYLAAKSLLNSDLEEGLAVVNSLADANLRSTAYREAADMLPPQARDRKLVLLRESLAQARRIDEPEWRLLSLGHVAERLLELGEQEEAEQLLREGERTARQLPGEGLPGHARRAFAGSLSLVDLDTALDLTAGAREDSDFDRHHGNIAHKLAARRPADAQRVWKMLRTDRQRDEYAVRVCYRMAPVDLTRAQSIASTIGLAQRRAYALGMMAQALAGTDKETAARLIDECFALLTDLVNRGDGEGGMLCRSYCVAVALLPVVETIDPALVREYLWRALSLRHGIATGNTTMVLGRHGEGQRLRLSDPVLAACLARYDRDLARLVLEPPGDEAIRAGFYPDFYFAALAMLDAPDALKRLDALPEATDEQKTRKRRASNEIVAALVHRNEGRWQWLLQRQYFLWVADHEDL